MGHLTQPKIRAIGIWTIEKLDPENPKKFE